jgi:hypothetical protein
MIAALFVQKNGVYYGLPDVDPWDAARDARLYAGPWPVVAHPPCDRWCQLAHVNQKRYGHKVGDDGGCFMAALHSVRKHGGVLEHPAFSYAWRHFAMQKPKRGGWIRDYGYHYGFVRSAPGWAPAWVTEVSQCAYGHRARKLTWLYYVGEEPPPVLDWSVPTPTAQVSFCKNHGNSPLPRLSKSEAKRTPIPFRDLLLSIARSAERSAA